MEETLVEGHQARKEADCRVVIGPEETAAARAAWPDIPIVALVEASEPDQAVYARCAGADVVLPTTDLATGWRHDTPGLAVAVSAATSLAERRNGIRDTSRRSGHDLGQALSAINLAAELAIGDRQKSERLLQQIQAQAQDAGVHAWRAGRAGRSSGLALGPVDLSAVLHRVATSEPDVSVYDSSGSAWVLGDVRRVEHLLEELIQYGRQAATSQRIEVKISSTGRIEIVIQGTGTHQQPAPARDIEFGLMAVGEIVNDLGGSIRIVEGKQDAGPHWIQLSFPLLPYRGHRAGLIAVPPDRMAIQADILEGVLRHAPLSESLEAIVEAIEWQLPGTKCSILLLHNGQTLHHGAGASLPEAYRNEIDGVAIGFGQGSCGTAAFLGEPVIAADVEHNPHWVNFIDLALSHDLRSCWSTPILAADGGAVLGTFAVYRSEAWEPEEAATHLVSRFTHLAAVAIGHHWLFNALAESESRFRNAFEGATAGMALVGLDGSILKVNPALSAMFDTTSTDLCRSNILDLVEPAHRARILRSWEDVLGDGNQEGEPESLEIPFQNRSSGDPLWASMRTSLVSAETGDQPQYFYAEIRDITASRRHAMERQAREAAEAASQAKTDFLALVSHELRTPLNAILGFAQVMKLVDLDPTQRADAIDNILTAGQHLLGLIGELLDLSLIEACQFKTVIENIDTVDAIDEAVQILQPLADSREIRLHRGPNSSAGLNTPATQSLEDSNTQHLVVDADRQCLRQVLINLVGNALKFTPMGGEVGITTMKTTSDSVRICVVDTGPGIAPAAIDDLFQPFHRLSRGSHHAEGTGLGLSVAAQLVDEMQGSIGVESSEGDGSCFWVELPEGTRTNNRALEQSEDPSEHSTDAFGHQPTSGSVLYVEDDPAAVQVIAATLALRPDIDLTTATTAAQGIAAARAHSFDAILLDIGLPDGSGWDVLRSLRDASATAAVPVVVLTAGPDLPPSGTPDPDRILAKPVDIETCLQAIDELLAPTG